MSHFTSRWNLADYKYDAAIGDLVYRIRGGQFNPRTCYRHAAVRPPSTNRR
jgi:hypothetical protein